MRKLVLQLNGLRDIFNVLIKTMRRCLLALVPIVFLIFLVKNGDEWKRRLFNLTPAKDIPVLRQQTRDPWTGVLAMYEETSNGTIFRYHNKAVNSTIGKPLLLSNFYKKRFDWPPTDYVTVSMDTAWRNNHVFVTGVSSNHYNEIIGMLHSVIKKYQGLQPKIILYDLGLTDAQIKEVSAVCHVVYRKFDYSAYPDHVTNLKNYAFKPIIMAEVLKEHPVIVWIDSSIRFIETGDFSHIKTQVVNTGGMVMMLSNHHSIHVATHPDLYTYLPPDRQKLKTTEMGGAGFLYITRTERVIKNLFLFYVLCALEVKCIQPTKNLACKGALFSKNQYAGCHRFDQSTIGLLLANHYNYNHTIYRDRMSKGDLGDFVRVDRRQLKHNASLITFC